MMMLEKNSDEIAGVIESWLKKTLATKPTRNAESSVRPPASSQGRA